MIIIDLSQRELLNSFTRLCRSQHKGLMLSSLMSFTSVAYPLLGYAYTKVNYNF